MMDGINDQSDEIDAVYIPPEVDTLTDEEDVNDDMNPRESAKPFDVVGTFELHVPDNTELPDQSFTLSTDEPEWDYQMTNHWNPKEDVCFPRTTGLLLLSNGKKVR
nr:unnamed protein product [Callosobruchus analis]